MRASRLSSADGLPSAADLTSLLTSLLASLAVLAEATAAPEVAVAVEPVGLVVVLAAPRCLAFDDDELLSGAAACCCLLAALAAAFAALVSLAFAAFEVAAAGGGGSEAGGALSPSRRAAANGFSSRWFSHSLIAGMQVAETSATRMTAERSSVPREWLTLSDGGDSWKVTWHPGEKKI